jgi:hypothetical protein
MFVSGKYCQPIIIRPGAYPRVKHLKGVSFAHAPALSPNIRVCQKGFVKDKHSSLLRKSVNYRQKSFIKLGPGANLIKIFCPCFTDCHTKLECLLE